MKTRNKQNLTIKLFTTLIVTLITAAPCMANEQKNFLAYDSAKLKIFVSSSSDSSGWGATPDCSTESCKTRVGYLRDRFAEVTARMAETSSIIMRLSPIYTEGLSKVKQNWMSEDFTNEFEYLEKSNSMFVLKVKGNQYWNPNYTPERVGMPGHFPHIEEDAPQASFELCSVWHTCESSDDRAAPNESEIRKAISFPTHRLGLAGADHTLPEPFIKHIEAIFTLTSAIKSWTSIYSDIVYLKSFYDGFNCGNSWQTPSVIGITNYNQSEGAALNTDARTIKTLLANNEMRELISKIRARNAKFPNSCFEFSAHYPVLGELKYNVEYRVGQERSISVLNDWWISRDQKGSMVDSDRDAAQLVLRTLRTAITKIMEQEERDYSVNNDRIEYGIGVQSQRENNFTTQLKNISDAISNKKATIIAKHQQAVTAREAKRAHREYVSKIQKIADPHHRYKKKFFDGELWRLMNDR